MSRTLRRRWAWDVPDGHLVTSREKTCRPGCGVCGKDLKRESRRRQRHDKRRETEFDIRA